MESFEAIQQKEFEQLTGEIGSVGRKLVELGWSRDGFYPISTDR